MAAPYRASIEKEQRTLLKIAKKRNRSEECEDNSVLWHTIATSNKTECGNVNYKNILHPNLICTESVSFTSSGTFVRQFIYK